MRKLITVFLILGITSVAYSQRERNYSLFIENVFSQGEVLKTNDFVRGLNQRGIPISDFTASDTRVGWQTRGTQQWHHNLKLPYYGIGFFNSLFSHQEEIGHPTALYFFFGGPFISKLKSSFDYEFGFGLSSNWKPYDELENPFNLAIGSYMNAFIDFKIGYSWYLGKKFSLNAGVRATHFSNGALRHPNSGINLLSPFVGLRYDFIAREDLINSIPTPEEDTPTEEFNIGIVLGERSVKHTTTRNIKSVSLKSLSLGYLKPGGGVFRYGLGLDVGIDENRWITVKEDSVELAPFKNQLFLGIAPIGQFRVNRLALQAGVGYELLSGGKFVKNQFYQRVGLRYYLSDHLFAGIAIKATNFSRADYIEWSLGFNLKRAKGE